MTLAEAFQNLVQVMKRLRAPGGCPWDREQTHDSIISYLIEEAHETQEALASRDWNEFKEELGDILCQVIFHANIAEENARFTLEEICKTLEEKLIRRHPHVFADTEVSDSDEVLNNWEKIKIKEKAEKEKRSKKKETILSGVPNTLPALMRSYRLGQKAARVGFEFPNTEDCFAKVEEEIGELKTEIGKLKGDKVPEEKQEELAGELGDLLFSLVNLSRRLKLNPENALLTSARKFQDRFTYIETELTKQGKSIEAATLEEMDALWEEAKNFA